MPKSKDKGGTPTQGRRRKQLVLSPINQSVNSEASTLPWDPEEDNSQQNITVNLENSLAGLAPSDSEGSSRSDPEDLPMRNDLPVKESRWSEDEVDALMDAINVNRDALKFHFEGSGGGKDVKRQGWKDVARYVNDVAATHRTVKQCVKKVGDFTQRQKGRFNRLRREVNRTGRGKIGKKYQMSEVQQKALDYIREEAITGIPGVPVMPTSADKATRTVSEENKRLLWTPHRENKPDYSAIDMQRKGVPKNYKLNQDNRKARLEKLQRKKDHEEKMKKERRKEEKQREMNEREHRLAELNRDKRTKALKGGNEKEYKQRETVYPIGKSYEIVDCKPKKTEAEELERQEAKAKRKAHRAAVRAEREERRRRRKEERENTD